MEEIKTLPFAAVKDAIKGWKIKYVSFQDDVTYYGFYVDNELVSICGVRLNGREVVFKNNFTFPQHRRKGYFTKFLGMLMQIYSGKKMVARCLDTSVSAYLANGFKALRKKQHKFFDITWVQYDKKSD